MSRHFAGLAVDDGNVVVFLQRHGDFAEAVDRDEFRLRIIRCNLGETGHRDALHRAAISHAVVERHDDEVTGRHLRQRAIVQVLVTLVFDGDGDE